MNTVDTNTYKGIGLMALAMLVFSILNAIIKDISQFHHPFQLVFFRCFFAAVPCAMILFFQKNTSSLFNRENYIKDIRVLWGLHFLRAICLSLALLLLFEGIRTLPLSNSMALYFSSSLFIVLLSYPLLKEKIKPFQWCLVLMGFFGILIIAQPTDDVFNNATLCIVGGAFFEACYNLLGRRLSPFCDKLTLTFWGSLLPAGLIFIPMLFVWEMPDTTGLIFLLLLGLGGGMGQLCVTSAYAYAPGASIAPVVYSAILWSSLLDFMLYHTVPDGYFWIGCSLVMSAGLYPVVRAFVLMNKKTIMR